MPVPPKWLVLHYGPADKSQPRSCGFQFPPDVKMMVLRTSLDPTRTDCGRCKRTERWKAAFVAVTLNPPMLCASCGGRGYLRSRHNDVREVCLPCGGTGRGFPPYDG